MLLLFLRHFQGLWVIPYCCHVYNNLVGFTQQVHERYESFTSVNAFPDKFSKSFIVNIDWIRKSNDGKYRTFWTAHTTGWAKRLMFVVFCLFDVMFLNRESVLNGSCRLNWCIGLYHVMWRLSAITLVNWGRHWLLNHSPVMPWALTWDSGLVDVTYIGIAVLCM